MLPGPKRLARVEKVRPGFRYTAVVEAFTIWSQEFKSVQIVGADNLGSVSIFGANGQILGHVTSFDCGCACLFEGIAEFG